MRRASTASAWLILFIFMGYLIAFYQNQQQPQPRDRFYFYPGSLLVFAVWIAVGVRELTELARDKIKSSSLKKTVVFANRYDGIDLPDDSCRILILDNKPYGQTLEDKYFLQKVQKLMKKLTSQ